MVLRFYTPTPHPSNITVQCNQKILDTILTRRIGSSGSTTTGSGIINKELSFESKSFLESLGFKIKSSSSSSSS